MFWTKAIWDKYLKRDKRGINLLTNPGYCLSYLMRLLSCLIEEIGAFLIKKTMVELSMGSYTLSLLILRFVI